MVLLAMGRGAIGRYARPKRRDDMYAMLARKTAGIEQDMAEFAETISATRSREFDDRIQAKTLERLMREAGCDTVATDAAGHVVGAAFGRSETPSLLLLDALSEPANGYAGLNILLHALLLLKRSLLPMQGHLAIATAMKGRQGLDLPVLFGTTLPSLDICPVCVVAETNGQAIPAGPTALPAEQSGLCITARGAGSFVDHNGFLVQAREALSDAGLDFGRENPLAISLERGRSVRGRSDNASLPALLFRASNGNGHGQAAAVGMDACVREAHRIAVVAYRMAGIPVCGWTADDV